MLTAFSAIANDGLMMQPHVFHSMIDGEVVRQSTPSTLGRPISRVTASQVTEMMVAAVRDGMANRATLPGYSIAGHGRHGAGANHAGLRDGTSVVSFVGSCRPMTRGSVF